MELVPRWGSPGLPAKDIVRMPRGKVFLFSGSQEACPIPEAEAPPHAQRRQQRATRPSKSPPFPVVGRRRNNVGVLLLQRRASPTSLRQA